MSAFTDYVAGSMLIGTIATAVMDLCSAALHRFGGVPPPNYALVGRWIAHMRAGRFRHDSMAAAAAVRGERLIGWTAHYLVGITFAALLLGIWGLEWTRRPALGPALIVGFGTLAAPFLLMQPGMGAGIAASRTPNPAAARVRSPVNHGCFALGLYVAGWLSRLLQSLW
ncbi:DUF2938 domain-containing protein [Fontimonas sp. SYSU GA230001]|uniref:DUF2938 domain-containing protein n=1 Tax=Fontimonas sp. SYSU GA230001 TaxID=3142450 RepID=UPI0032B3663F